MTCCDLMKWTSLAQVVDKWSETDNLQQVWFFRPCKTNPQQNKMICNNLLHCQGLQEEMQGVRF